MKIKHKFTLVDDTTTWSMSISKDEVTPGVFPGILANTFDHLSPVGVISIAVVHNFDLSKVDSFQTHVDPSLPQIKKQHTGLQPTHVWNPSALQQVIAAAPQGLQHILVTKIPRFRHETELFEYGGRNRDIVDISGDNFEDRALKYDIGIHKMNTFDKWFALPN